MTEITPEKYAEAEDHFITLISALYDLIVDAYGTEMANLLFENLNCSDEEEYCCLSKCKEDIIKEQAHADYIYIKKAMEILDNIYKFDK